MIGIGVGIDYALFIVTRYRQGLHDGRRPRGARSCSRIDTAGRAVLFAGCTVVISLLGMFLMGISFIQRPRGRRRRSRCWSRCSPRSRCCPRCSASSATTSTSSALPAPRSSRGHDRRRRSGTAGAASCSADPGPRRRSASSSCSCSPSRCSRSGSASPTPATTRRRHARAGPTTCCPRASVPASTARSRCVAVDAGARPRPTLHDGRTPRLAADRRRRVRDARPAQPERRRRRDHASFPTTSPQDEATTRARAPPPRRRHPDGDARHRTSTCTSAASPRSFDRLRRRPRRAAPVCSSARVLGSVVPAADGRVPLDPRAAQGRDR